MVIGRPLSGIGAEVGAGSGLYTACASRLPTVEKIYAVEYSEDCVANFMPVVFRQAGADVSKIVRVCGSYNSMELEDGALDFILCFGAFHHSEDLARTARECYRVLKPGGWLIAGERARVNSSDNLEIRQALSREVSAMDRPFSSGEQGQILGAGEQGAITRAMNSEHEPRLCEYEADFARAGFKVRTFTFVCRRGHYYLFPLRLVHYLFFLCFGDRMLRKRMDTIRFVKIPYFPWFAEGAVRRLLMGRYSIDPLFLVCEKRAG
jgi:SAM-dependent methyltransferase